ncbi:MAG: hypothetical protein U0169_24395 [Polyangiaceae bacterium]
MRAPFSIRFSHVSLAALLALGGANVLACSSSSTSDGTPKKDAGADGAVTVDAGEPPTLGPTSEDPFAACTTSVAAAEERGLDLLVLLDKSGSMAQSRKWISVTAGLKSYFQSSSSAAVGLGLQMFPGASLCDETKYEKPLVDFIAEGEARDRLMTSLDSVIPDGPTPMAPALWGAVQRAHAWAIEHPDRNVAVLLATDGLPDQTCQFSATGVPQNTLEGVEEIAAKARALVPRVSVAVIGVGSALGELNRIAFAGGTSEAAIIGESADQESVFVKALEAVRRKTVPCEFKIERSADPDEETLDFGKVNVGFQADATKKEALGAVTTSDACNGVDNGWRYDDPENPTQIELCPDTCRRLRDTADGSIRLVFGCKTVIR